MNCYWLEFLAHKRIYSHVNIFNDILCISFHYKLRTYLTWIDQFPTLFCFSGCCCIDEFDKMGSQHQALLEAMVRLFELNFTFCLSLFYKASTLGQNFDKISVYFVLTVTLSSHCHSYQSSPLFITFFHHLFLFLNAKHTIKILEDGLQLYTHHARSLSVLS